jgi:hypothetical protein
MPYIASLLALILSTSALAASNAPPEFLGLWVPRSNSCDSSLSFLVETGKVTLRNGDQKRSFGDLDFCFSCEGGARYNGIVVWMKPEFSSSSEFFTAQFNAGEKRGVTKLEIRDKAIKRDFPLDGILLKKCP